MDEARTGSDEVATVKLPGDPDADTAVLAGRDADPPALPLPALPLPDRVSPPAVAEAWAGRYTMIRKLAEGGMGEVFIAYDDQLDRRVAMKLVRQVARSPTVRQRMQREAQALARLSHPNVVQVYDVGVHADRLFVTMELIVGSDLRKWWNAAPRTWQAVVDVLLQAGEGLAAAHRAGLVHRDIKPDNILVGDDGRVAVADFGLARADHDHADEPAATPQDHAGSLLDSPLTEQGALVGTPAYMAPEQFQRQPVDARTDLFAFCVVLYEGVFGERPFRGKNWQEIGAAALSGRFFPPPRDPPIPGWLTRVLARGLSVEPADRHPTIDALLAELRRPQQSARRRRQWALALGGLALGLALGAATLAGPAPCTDADAGPAALWTPDRQAALDAAITAAAPGLAAEVSPRLTARLDRRVQDLRDMSRETCLAYQQGELSDTLYDRARACLDRRSDEVAALLTVLAAPDVELVARALPAADALHDLTACRDRDALLAQIPPPDPTAAAAVLALAHRLAEARAQRIAGRVREADALLGPLVADADALAYAPLSAEAKLERGLVALELRRVPAAADDLAAAFSLAESAGADELRLAALTAWLRAAGTDGATPALLPLLERQALALVERRGETGARPHALALLAAGEAHLDLDIDHASTRLDAAIALFEALGEPAAPDLAEALNDLALVRTMQRRYPEAHALYQRARGLLAVTLGPHHPNLAYVANNEARAYDKEGDPQSARTWFTAALDLWEPAFGPDHPNTLIAALHLARVSADLRDDDTAATLAARVLAARARAQGETHTSLAQPLQILARVELRRDDRAGARSHAERALAILEQANGRDSSKLFETLTLLGQVALADHRTDDALALVTRARDLASSDAARARADLDLARVHWARDEPTAAHLAADRAAPHLAADVATWVAEHPRPGR